MKTLKILSILLLCAFFSQGQSPDEFNYQAVARDGSGAIIGNTNIAVRFSVRDATTGGTIVYQERQTTSTNQFGLFTCRVGTGTVLSGNIATVDWAGDNKFLQVEFDPTGGTSYINMGTSQLVSVPYAKVADVINMFPGGVNNADKMIITHSPAYQNYGLQYQDVGDKFNFLSGGIPVLTVDVSSDRSVGIGTSSPVSPLDVRGNVSVSSDTGLVTVINTGTGNAIKAEGSGTSLSNGAAIFGQNTNNGTAIAGVTSGAGYAIYGYNSTGPAAHFTGDVETVGDVSTTGFTTLGSGSPAIKTKTITGTTSANTGGGTSSTLHGLNASKILSVNVLVEHSPGQFTPSDSFYTGREFTFSITATSIMVALTATNSNSLGSVPFKAFIVYEQ